MQPNGVDSRDAALRKGSQKPLDVEKRLEGKMTNDDDKHITNKPVQLLVTQQHEVLDKSSPPASEGNLSVFSQRHAREALENAVPEVGKVSIGGVFGLRVTESRGEVMEALTVILREGLNGELRGQKAAGRTPVLGGAGGGREEGFEEDRLVLLGREFEPEVLQTAHPHQDARSVREVDDVAFSGHSSLASSRIEVGCERGVVSHPGRERRVEGGGEEFLELSIPSREGRGVLGVGVEGRVDGERRRGVRARLNLGGRVAVGGRGGRKGEEDARSRLEDRRRCGRSRCKFCRLWVSSPSVPRARKRRTGDKQRVELMRTFATASTWGHRGVSLRCLWLRLECTATASCLSGV